jgi:hypothetical protein
VACKAFSTKYWCFVMKQHLNLFVLTNFGGLSPIHKNLKCENPFEILAVENLRRGLHFHARARAKTGFAVCLPEFNQQNLFNTAGTFLG